MPHDEGVIERLKEAKLLSAIEAEVSGLMAGGVSREQAIDRLSAKYPTESPGELGARASSARDEKDYRLAIEWVAAKMTKLSVKESDAPNDAAWGMLMWARSSDQNQTRFYTDLLPKMLPTKQQMDREARFTDDGRVLKLVQELMKESKA